MNPFVSFIESLFGPKVPNLGAVSDTRPESDRKEDIPFKEIVASAAPVQWAEKDPSQWRHFSIRDQDGSSSCVQQTIAKIAEILYYLKTGEKMAFSAGFYKHRSNYPAEGMTKVDAFGIWASKGISTESLIPSQKMSENQMNSIKYGAFAGDVAVAFSVGGSINIPVGSFEEVASVIQKTGKGIMVWMFFENKEWTDIPSIMNIFLNKNSAKVLRHSITIVDFTLYKGKKYLVIEDSWGKFGKFIGQRLISEEFFVARNYETLAYPMSFKYISGEQKPVRPVHKFEVNLKFGDDSTDVQFLQDILKYEGLFPSNIESTGKYYALTAKSVLAFQIKYRIAPEAELIGLKGETVGLKTREALNQLYGVIHN